MEIFDDQCKWLEWLFNTTKARKRGRKRKVRPELPDTFSVERPLVFMMNFHLQESFLDSRVE